jgi:hypothetical protein
MLNVHAVKNTRAPAQAKKNVKRACGKKTWRFSAGKQKTFNSRA